MMINVSELHRRVIQAKIGTYSHKQIKELLNGNKGKFLPKDIQCIQGILRKEMTLIDKKLDNL